MAPVDPKAETRRREPPAKVADPLGWCDAHQFDLAAADGSLGVSVRLALHPAARRAWYWAYVVRPDEGPVVVRDHDVPFPRAGLEVRAEGLWAELICETPLEHWSLRLEAFGVQLDDPLDATTGEIGTRMPVGLDLGWELLAPAEPDATTDPAARGYVQPGRVHGEVLLGAARIEIDGFGVHRHEWGPVPWASAVATRVTAVNADVAVSATLAAHGGLRGWRRVRGVETDQLDLAERGLLETRRDARGLPLAARLVIARSELEVEVVGVAPVPVERPGGPVRLDRALIRATPGDDDAGLDEGGGGSTPLVGWAEWFVEPGFR
jgi:hypothetical protein